MKINGEILEVKTTGDQLLIRLQGTTVNAPEWAGWAQQSITVPDNARTRKAFHIGRLVEITIKPKADRL